MSFGTNEIISDQGGVRLLCHAWNARTGKLLYSIGCLATDLASQQVFVCLEGALGLVEICVRLSRPQELPLGGLLLGVDGQVIELHPVYPEEEPIVCHICAHLQPPIQFFICVENGLVCELLQRRDVFCDFLMTLVVVAHDVKIAVIHLDEDFNRQPIQHQLVLCPFESCFPVLLSFAYAVQGVYFGAIDEVWCTFEGHFSWV
mmetsp:Transcript_35011/g.46059  ORF Transcript_35011/g.46059 Transcript_35011/m.46059 type:complete len:203 (+) Transcript_35011:48-656(+)